MKYYIQRNIPGHSDTLACMWEGNDLPTFKRDGNPYLFEDRKVAERVLWRLQARFPTTIETPHFRAMPIEYATHSIDLSGDTYEGQRHFTTQCLSQFV